MTRPWLGAHMSIAGGCANALRAGREIDCDAIQMFTRSANRWSSKDLTPEEIAEFVAVRQETGMHAVVAHSSYLINLGSPDDGLWNKSVGALVIEMRRCQQLGVQDYVLHPGAHMGAGEEAGLSTICRALDQALAATPETEAEPTAVRILLETTAGQGTVLGNHFEQLAWLIERSSAPERLGVCLDTAHILASGYEYRQPETYEAMWAHFDAVIGRDRLHAVHLNDSLKDVGTHVDRHTQIGKGFVGVETFRRLLNDPRLANLPMLLETPRSDDLHETIEDLTLLRGLFA
jgi:deoxyribonuclease-4